MSLRDTHTRSQSKGWSFPGLASPYERRAPTSTATTNSKTVLSHAPAASEPPDPRDLSSSIRGSRSLHHADASSHQSRKEGFLGRHMRKISEGLPYFTHDRREDRRPKSWRLGNRSNKYRMYVGPDIFTRAENGRWLTLLLITQRGKAVVAIATTFLLLLFLGLGRTWYFRLGLKFDADTGLKLYKNGTAGRLHSAEAVVSLSSSQQTRREESWIGKAPENGRSRETVCSTRSTIAPGGAMSWRSWT